MEVQKRRAGVYEQAILRRIIDDELSCLHAALCAKDDQQAQVCKARLTRLHAAMKRLS